MKILVTGGAGFIGSHIVDSLLAEGHDVRVLDNLESPTHLKGKPDYLPDDVDFIKGDMADKEYLLKALDDVEGIFHFAAAGGFAPDIMRYIRSNTVGTALMMDLIQEGNIPVKKVVVASSVAVYGEGEYGCEEHGAFYPGQRPLKQLERGEWDFKCPACGKKAEPSSTDEKCPVSPNTVYSITKYDQERLVLFLGKRNNIPSTALRLFLTYGPRQDTSYA